MSLIEQPQPARTRMVVADVVPIFDTARFEHYGRIALVVADTWMMPESLTHDGPKEKRVPLDPGIIKARAFRIVALADRWNCDPFQLMGACSFVYNQLMIEGKVIHGVIDAELGVILDYDFGKWDAASETCVVGEPGAGDAMAVCVSAELGGKLRTVDGSVGVWKTSGSNTPWKPGAFKRMLRYRGAREWARAHKPSLLIGIIGDDEMDDYRERRDVVQTASIGLDPGFPAQERLGGPQTGDKPETGKRASRARKAPDASQGGQDDGKSDEVITKGSHPANINNGAQYIDPDTGEVYDTIEARLAAEQAKREAGGGEVIEGESRVVQTAEQGSDTKGSATDASTASQADNSGQQQQDDKSSAGEEEQVEEGIAAPGEVYFLAGETFDASTGRRTTYRDGRAFSSASRKVLDDGKTLIYLNHAPEAEQRQGEQTGASDTTSASTTTSPTGTASETASTDETGAHPFIEAISKIAEAPHWDAIKQASRSAQKQEQWKTDEPGRTLVRQRMWDRYVELRNAGEGVTGIATDMALMALWLDFAADSEEAIDAMWRGFFRNPAYTQATKPDQSTITAKMMERKAALKGGG